MLDSLLGICLCHVLANLEKWSDIPQLISVNKTVYNWYQRNFHTVWEFTITYNYPNVRVPDYVQGNQIIAFAHALSFAKQVFEVERTFKQLHNEKRYDILIHDQIFEAFDYHTDLPCHSLYKIDLPVLTGFVVEAEEYERISLYTKIGVLGLNFDTFTYNNQQLVLQFDLLVGDNNSSSMTRLDHFFGAYFSSYQNDLTFDIDESKQILISEQQVYDGLLFDMSHPISEKELTKFMFELWRFGFRWDISVRYEKLPRTLVE